MPAPVPSGYTRGSILFIPACQDEKSEGHLLQYFWEEAGAYGARIAIVAGDKESAAVAARCRALFAEWETDSVEILSITSREESLQPGNLEQITGATGILLLGENPVRMATFLGGTPLAQAIRRANARGKVAAGYGRGAALLCEHMIAHDSRAADDTHHPFLHRHLIQFAPGLGLTNRLVLDTIPAELGDSWNRLSRLLHAVAYNPFLVGVSLEVDTGAVIYQDNSLEIFGRHSALVVDGSGITYTDIADFRNPDPLSLLGVKIHALADNFTYHLQERTARPPESSDIPQDAVPVKAMT
ncbi:MAG: cyanophycinase [Caldilineaceae bacterium]|nr:cyanophycinase [Caldilineaceae bacterium]